MHQNKNLVHKILKYAACAEHRSMLYSFLLLSSNIAAVFLNTRIDLSFYKTNIGQDLVIQPSTRTP